jgi:LysM repeat protein
MFDKRFLIFLATALLLLGLTACVRPASTPPSSESEAAPTSAEGFPLPGETEDVMSQLEQAATQTLMAAQGTPVTSPTAPVVDATAVAAQQTPVVEATSEVQLTSTPIPAASATPVPLPSPTPGIPASWTLQKGEHPYCIARRFDVNPSELLRLNGLSANSFFYGGMVLKIPQTGNPFPAGRALQAHPTNVTVSSGDTIYSIACEFGDVDPYAIAAANGISSPYALTAGQNLYIP